MTVYTPLFFVAQTVKNILREAYGDKTTVSDELVDCILKPGAPFAALNDYSGDSNVYGSERSLFLYFHGKRNATPAGSVVKLAETRRCSESLERQYLNLLNRTRLL